MRLSPGTPMPRKTNHAAVTAAGVIDALGGPQIVSQHFGIDIRVVSNWKTRGFPPDTYLAFKALLQKRRMTAPPELWGMRFLDDQRGGR